MQRPPSGQSATEEEGVDSPVRRGRKRQVSNEQIQAKLAEIEHQNSEKAIAFANNSNTIAAIKMEIGRVDTLLTSDECLSSPTRRLELLELKMSAADALKVTEEEREMLENYYKNNAITLTAREEEFLRRAEEKEREKERSPEEEGPQTPLKARKQRATITTEDDAATLHRAKQKVAELESLRASALAAAKEHKLYLRKAQSEIAAVDNERKVMHGEEFLKVSTDLVMLHHEVDEAKRAYAAYLEQTEAKKKELELTANEERVYRGWQARQKEGRLRSGGSSSCVPAAIALMTLETLNKEKQVMIREKRPQVEIVEKVEQIRDYEEAIRRQSVGSPGRPRRLSSRLHRSVASLHHFNTDVAVLQVARLKEIARNQFALHPDFKEYIPLCELSMREEEALRQLYSKRQSFLHSRYRRPVGVKWPLKKLRRVVRLLKGLAGEGNVTLPDLISEETRNIEWDEPQLPGTTSLPRHVRVAVATLHNMATELRQREKEQLEKQEMEAREHRAIYKKYKHLLEEFEDRQRARTASPPPFPHWVNITPSVRDEAMLAYTSPANSSSCFPDLTTYDRRLRRARDRTTWCTTLR